MSSSPPATSLPRASAALQSEHLVPTHESSLGTGHMGAHLFLLALPSRPRKDTLCSQSHFECAFFSPVASPHLLCARGALGGAEHSPVPSLPS